MNENCPSTMSECFSDLPDLRIDRTKKHKLVDVVIIGLCTILSGGEGFNDMELFAISRIDWPKNISRNAWWSSFA